MTFVSAAARARRVPGGLADRVQPHDEGLGVHDGPAAGGAGPGRGGARQPPGVFAHRAHGLLRAAGTRPRLLIC